jgi:hypothetical protein
MVVGWRQLIGCVIVVVGPCRGVPTSPPVEHVERCWRIPGGRVGGPLETSEIAGVGVLTGSWSLQCTAGSVSYSVQVAGNSARPLKRHFRDEGVVWRVGLEVIV